MHGHHGSGNGARFAARTAAPMTSQQRQQFEDDGFVIVPDALDQSELERYTAALDAAYDQERKTGGEVDATGALHKLSAVANCPALVDLVDHPAVFPLVWSIIGWNIHVTHSRYNVHPPLRDAQPFRWRWHQDGGRQNIELETDPRPRLTVFSAFWLSDVSEPGRGNMMVIPGSHKLNWLQGPPGPTVRWPVPDDAMEVTAHPGDVLFYDRRIWHSRSDNHSDVTRKAVFFGYTYRWIAVRDDVPDPRSSPELAHLSPIQRQLLDIDTDTGDGRWGHSPDTIPLYAELRKLGLLDRDNRAHKRLFA
jgi:ectoine hydroxylase-related dioxygenase (phytanoyl-CoA dioxygenase family)